MAASVPILEVTPLDLKEDYIGLDKSALITASATSS